MNQQGSAKGRPGWLSNIWDHVKNRYCELKKNPNAARIFALRALCFVVLVAAAASTTTLAYIRFESAQYNLFISRFDSVSQSALNSVVDRFSRMNVGIQELSSTYSHNFPDASEWPYVAWKGFEPTATLLGKASSVQGLAFLPIVRPDQVESYKAFSDGYYSTDPYCDKADYFHRTFPGGAIWWSDFYTGLPVAPDFLDHFGNHTDSPYEILTPLAQYTFSSLAGPNLANYNVHSNPLYVGALDSVIECVAAHNYSYARESCGVISLFAAIDDKTDMVAIYLHPILPQNNQSTITGFSVGTISWKELLTNVIPVDVSGVDCVIESDIGAFTFHIDNGIPRFVGEGDHHNTKYSEHRTSGNLLSAHVTISHSTSYTLSFYPTHELQESFETNQPMQAAVFNIIVFLFCSALFCFYDFLTRKEFDRNQAVLDTKRRFVRFISHEIRTPLNTVRLGMKLLEVEMAKFSSTLSKTDAADLFQSVKAALRSWKQLADEIVESSESAVEVLNDLLNYDKIEIGTMKLEFSYCDIRGLVEKTVTAMQVQAQQKDIILQWDCTWARTKIQLSGDANDDLPVEDSQGDERTVVADAARMGQVLRNLISNALKFTPSYGKVAITVSANATISPVTDEVRSATPLFQSMAQAGTVRIAVKDSGAGLSPQQLAEICAEGVQFNANELQAGQGSGLGLFISKGIIEQHGGRLVVESEGLGKGVTFTVELPLFRFDWHSKPNRASLRSMQSRGSRDFSVASEAALLSIAGDLEHHEHTIKTGAHCGPQRLLVVDDSVFNRKMMVRLLVTQDHTCEQAEDGAAAVRKYLEMVERGEPPDAILMDYEMPVMNGPSATARLREIGCACLILGVTGNVLPAEVSIFREHGADDVLAKPLVLETLTTLLMAGRATPIAAFTECTKPSASVQQHPHDKVLPFEIV